MPSSFLWKLCAISIFVFFAHALISQPTFQQDINLLNGHLGYGVYTVGAVDLNGDYRDDIIQVDNGSDVTLFNQCGNDAPMKKVVLENPYIGSPWTLCSADLNDDNLREIMLAGAYDGVTVYGHTKNTNSGYEVTQDINHLIFAQGSNFADIDNDGDLDLFMCHDEGSPSVFINAPNDSLFVTGGIIDFNTVPVSDNSGNYGSEWVDIDSDGDQDLHIAKCRTGATEETDPRRINALFINDGQGNFEEKAEEFGIAIGRQSWVTTFSDLDNDGDLDAYVVNHFDPHQILINNDNTSFTSLEVIGGTVINTFAIQSIMQDFDNNGFVDILVTGPEDYLLSNNGGMDFTVIENPFGSEPVYSAASGDFNDDGFMDLFANFSSGLSIPATLPDEIWTGNPNGNNYVKISLEGRSSNLNGVGARVLLYGDWGVMRRDVKSGESYGIVNSANLNFGLGSNSSIDSLVIYWPSGIKEVEENLEINRQYLKIEEACISSFLPVEGDRFICDNSSITLSIDTNDPVLWSNGMAGSSIEVSEAGSYFARIETSADCYKLTELVCVENLLEVNDYFIVADGDKTLCQGEHRELSVGDSFENTTWSTGESGSSIDVDTSGTYSAQYDLGGCVLMHSIVIDVIETEIMEIENDTVYMEGEEVTLFANGDSITWYESLASDMPLGTGTTYTTTIDATTSFYADNTREEVVPQSFFGIEIPEDPPFFGTDQINGHMDFDVSKPIHLVSVDVFTDVLGERLIELRNDSGIVLFSTLVDIQQAGKSNVVLDYMVPVGLNYVLTTNSNTNLQNLGTVSPQFQSNNGTNDVDYPYTVDGLVSIKGSNFGMTNYFYFYNWELDNPDRICVSDRVEVKGVLETSSVQDVPLPSITLLPNPTSGMVSIQLEDSKMLSINIYNAQGKRIMSAEGSSQIDLAPFDTGVYFVRLRTDRGIYLERVIKL